MPSQTDSTRPALSDSTSKDEGFDRKLQTCAELIAFREIEWPTGLSAAQSTELETMVARARRRRLVKLIATCIAADIASDANSELLEIIP